jgi:aminopeptidase N
MEDLRAAVEAASHRDLSELFRAWMNHPGVPEDFRTRYAAGSRGP